MPGLLILSTVDPRLQFGARTATNTQIRTLAKATAFFKKKIGRSPNGLRELSEFLKSNNIEIGIHDYYGNKIEFNHLDHKILMLRSHGPNNLNEKPKGIHRNLFWASDGWKDLFKTIAPKPYKAPLIYQPAFLLSSASYDKKYIARIFYNSETGRRALVVVNNNISKEPVYVNQIDNPEEILWLPASSILAFTSSPNYGRQESVQIIDIKSLESVSIKLEGLNLQVNEQQKTTKFFATLAGPKLGGFLFYANTNFDTPIKGDSMFKNENLFEVTVSNNLRPEVKRSAKKLSPKRFKSQIEPMFGEGTPLQKKWFNLETSGNVSDTIKSWQDFAVEAKDSPTFPYALYYLIAFYEKAAALLLDSGKKQEGQTLYALSGEYAKALSELHDAPTWLSLSGWGAWESLVANEATGIEILGHLHNSELNED